MTTIQLIEVEDQSLISLYMKRNNFYLMFLPVLMFLLQVSLITGCGETELECYKRHVVGTWEEVGMPLPFVRSAPLPVEEIWGLTPWQAGIKLDFELFPRVDRVVLDADGSYLIQATDIVDSSPSLAGRWNLWAKFHLEERGTYELFDPREVVGHTVYIKFFPKGVDVKVEDAQLRKRGEATVYLDVEPMNEWLNNVGIYGDTMMSVWGNSEPYSGEEIPLHGNWIDDEVWPHCR